MTLVYVGIGLLLIILAIPMILGKVPPNRWYGFRTARTLSDPAVWYPANAYSGKALLAAGIVISLSAIVLALIPDISDSAYIVSMVGILPGALLLAVAASLRYLRSI